MGMTEHEQVRCVLACHGAKLMSLPNVVGIGAGYKVRGGELTDLLSLVVMVARKLPKRLLTLKDAVPRKLDDIFTDVVQTGSVRLTQLDPVRVSPQRPAFPGVSIGHYKVTAGTFGAVVRDRSSGRLYILSNNHILANLTDGQDGRGKVGDPILQPGRVDGGTGRNVIAWLERFVPVDRAGTNRLDCALARPLSEAAITDGIYGIGRVTGVRAAELGMTVLKSGRTTGVNEGRVLVVNATLQVGMGEEGKVNFVDQIVASAPTEGGDSGSLVVDEKRDAVGLLFAGSETVMAFNPIQPVLEALDITF